MERSKRMKKEYNAPTLEITETVEIVTTSEQYTEGDDDVRTPQIGFNL